MLDIQVISTNEYLPEMNGEDKNECFPPTYPWWVMNNF